MESWWRERGEVMGGRWYVGSVGGCGGGGGEGAAGAGGDGVGAAGGRIMLRMIGRFFRVSIGMAVL